MKYLVLFALGAATLPANILINGGFERPDISGDSRVFPTGSTGIPGWVIGNIPPETMSIVKDTFVDGNLTFLPQAGTQSLNLTGDFPGEAATIAQDVTLTVGHQYELSFWIGNQDNSVTNYTLDSEAGLYLNGNLISFYTNSDNTHHAVNWKQFTYDFTATVADNSVEFQNLTLSFDHYIGLDSVDLEDLTRVNTTPEPAILWLAGSALLSVAYLARRRSS
jgi:hypothetical protein